MHGGDWLTALSVVCILRIVEMELGRYGGYRKVPFQR